MVYLRIKILRFLDSKMYELEILYDTHAIKQFS
jgi:hypothetical protein